MDGCNPSLACRPLFFKRCFDEEMVDDDAAMAVPRCVAAQRGRVLGLLLFFLVIEFGKQGKLKKT
jgi:hypothetical protein